MSIDKQKSRAWTFTCFEYEDKYDQIVENLAASGVYFILGKEICPTTNKKHLQGYAYFANAVSGLSLKKKLEKSKCHIEKARGTAEDSKKYCSKEGDFYEYGEIPKQGKRNDLNVLAESIKNKKITVDEITESNPYAYHEFGRTIEKLEDLVMNKTHRTTMTEGVWLYGGTGEGKSHIAFENFDSKTHYVHNPEDKGWWDGYKGQKIVIVNDFRGEFKYNYLLQLVDKWPFTVPRRNRCPMQFVAEKIIITSSKHPKNIYRQAVEDDKIDQLYRRFDIYEVKNHLKIEMPTDARTIELNRKERTEMFGDETTPNPSKQEKTLEPSALNAIIGDLDDVSEFHSEI